MFPSIFNDVLGPVMRGPSSSHVAAASRIGQLTRDALTQGTKSVSVSFGANSSLAHTYHSQGSDMGFAAGLAGIPLDDARAVHALDLLGLPLSFSVVDGYDAHPSNYRVRLDAGDSALAFQAISTGGGMIELWEINGVPVSLKGDRHVLALLDPTIDAARAAEAFNLRAEAYEAEGRRVLVLSSASAIPAEAISSFAGQRAVHLKPVLPVPTPEQMALPFTDYAGLLAFLSENEDVSLGEAALRYECARGGLSANQVHQHAERVLKVMRASAQTDLSLQAHDRILPAQAYRMGKMSDRLIPLQPLNDVITCVTAVMESKSAMRPIVAAPTAGSCGCLAGSLVGLNCEDQGALLRALLAGGLVGVLFCKGATFAAEVAGCQVECGAASGMTAAALTELYGGTATECLAAASLAIQALTGLACDPVAGRVEVPCLGKNIAAAANALCCANMALAGYAQVVPLDEVIEAVMIIGEALPSSLKCTHGGLGMTRASAILSEKLAENA